MLDSACGLCDEHDPWLKNKTHSAKIKCVCTFHFRSFAIFAFYTSQSEWSSLLSTPAAVASATLPLSRTLARSQQNGHIPKSSYSINLQWKFTPAFQQSQWIQWISESNFNSAGPFFLFLCLLDYQDQPRPLQDQFELRVCLRWRKQILMHIV